MLFNCGFKYAIEKKVFWRCGFLRRMEKLCTIERSSVIVEHVSQEALGMLQPEKRILFLLFFALTHIHCVRECAGS